MGNIFSSAGNKVLPIDTSFSFPFSVPTWPSGEGSFASGNIDLGEGLEVTQITTFTKIWSSKIGGPDNMGATFFEPSSLPDGFFMLGTYAQPNNQPLFGWILVGKDKNDASSSGTSILQKPTDYILVWSSESLKGIDFDSPGYVWLPIPPEGYKALGHIVTNTNEKPSLDKIRCVRSDFTEVCETETWIWGPGDTEDTESEMNVYSLRPTNRGIQAQGVSIGSFFFKEALSQISSFSCLKNNNFNLSSMPNQSQVEALVQTYSPFIYFHPEEPYAPSSVNWYFSNGVMLYKQGDESNPLLIEPNGSNLPQGGSNDGTYWIDLPENEEERERVKKGDLETCEAYIHVKPMFGGTFTDIAMWIFFPFNGPVTAKLGLIDLPLGMIGQHIGDWEHLTLRISNFNGLLYRVYFSEHSSGSWIDTPLLEFQESSNKVIAYSSKNGHAFYSKPGLVLQGVGDVGIRNDTAKSDLVLDMGAKYAIVAGDIYNGTIETIVEPPWVNYYRKWGPKIDYTLADELEKLESLLIGVFKTLFESLVEVLPNEILGEDGPTGPKVKNSWVGDEA
ncbi:hypothetical protein Leryth_010870 [Lithospermum erythrorhizon]|nr:hypothetical protein Leryth_010870 [Lithospermum erythrorhizon]